MAVKVNAISIRHWLIFFDVWLINAGSDLWFELWLRESGNVALVRDDKQTSTWAALKSCQIVLSTRSYVSFTSNPPVLCQRYSLHNGCSRISEIILDKILDSICIVMDCRINNDQQLHEAIIIVHSNVKNLKNIRKRYN